MSDRSEILDAIFTFANCPIGKYSPDSKKVKKVLLTSGETISVDKLREKILKNQASIFSNLEGSQTKEASTILKLISGLTADFEKILREHATNNSVIEEASSVDLPKGYEDVELNVDTSNHSRELKFFLTKDDLLHPSSAWLFIRAMGMNEDAALAAARAVHPSYQPRSPKGVFEKNINEVSINCLNTYLPPAWMSYKGDLPDSLPETFLKLIDHLYPLKIEKEYFFSWLYHSLFERASVYLVLCGAPGIGKNRLKLVMRALHGHDNTVDGKRSTITERFNSQLSETTLCWFDELHYNHEMENFMKEVQNDSTSIERKGQDATRSTDLFSSMVISNNRPRDNFIDFNSRKFSPLLLSSKRLEESMTPKEIDLLSSKVEKISNPAFDIKYIARIGRWVKKHGRSDKWPNLEYRGPMFYKLAHTSMSRWQKKAATIIFDPPDNIKRKIEGDKYSWSAIEEFSKKKNGDRSLDFPDYSSVKAFFDSFLDGNGNNSFKTKTKPGKNPMGDFWVWSLNPEGKIITEQDVDIGGEDEEIPDL